MSPSNMARIFSYAFTTAGRGASNAQDDTEGGPYAAQYIGGMPAVADGGSGDASMFGEITGKGLQTGLGTIAGLGYGLPMSRLYAKWVFFPVHCSSHLLRPFFKVFWGVTRSLFTPRVGQ